jgi:predicted DNA-binding WGR domain protein
MTWLVPLAAACYKKGQQHPHQEPAAMSAEEKTYLELSEEGGGSHKFYEVTVQGKDVTIRYGRIGDPGQTSTKTYPSADAARADARKKIDEKKRKGYEAAVQGARQKRAVTRRSVASQPSKAKRAPVLWKFASGTTAFGIFIDDRHCWVGNVSGRVFALDHDGKVEKQFKLPEGVMCLVGDDEWIYAGCDDGNVYDLTGQVPRLAYTISEDVSILWLDIWAGFLAVSDDEGKVVLIGPEEEKLWTRKAKGDSGWMVRCDSKAVFHGHSGGVDAYDRATGAPLWRQKKAENVLFGWQTQEHVYPGTAEEKVHRLNKDKGKEEAVCSCDDSVMSNASADDGRYIFAADSASSIYCFDPSGKRLWKLGTGCGSALSMQMHHDRLYIVTTSGTLACLDASDAAVLAAQAGTVPTAREIKAPREVAAVPTTQVETTADASQGVVVECVAEGSKLRVRVVSPGYNRDWNVQFPRNLREPGARFVVESVRESAQKGFYRAHGEIRKFAQGEADSATSRRRPRRS